MAWQAGIVNSAADLVAAIQAFAVAQGWTLTGSVLSKGAAHVEITAPSASEVRIRGARNGVFSGGDVCSRHSRVAFTAWPSSIELQMFAHVSPDTVWITLRINATDYMHLGFGSMAKYGDWVGGQWFHAQHHMSNRDGNCCSTIDGYLSTTWAGEEARECGLFWSQRDGRDWDFGGYPCKTSYLHCELRGYVWEATGSAADKTALNVVHCPTILSPIHRSNPNGFNGQTVLTPFQLFLQNTDGHYMSIGHLGHLRFVKLTNYNPGDIIEIASDRWRVFPWLRKDLSLPNGRAPTYSDGTFSTGVMGVAVRYDGP